MSGLYAILLASPALLMLVVGVIPNSHANRRAGLLRRLVPLLLVWQFVSVVAFELRLGSGPLVANGQVGVVPIGIFLDGVSALMMGMVSLVGWVICTYSIRYLDSDPDQGRYFRWASFTIGSVLMLVVSGNLAMFACFWIATSMGLHQLLVQRGDRAAATRAAWTKFGISRIGDAALIFAVFLIHSEFGTIRFDQLFLLLSDSEAASTTAKFASIFLVVGAMTKSAQFPFHSWLPMTLETPTPVSALMHAGIVNAGGFLIIRMSPMLVHAPLALNLLAVVGTVSVLLGLVVMSTQTSIKKALAYSTVAQMGFMMLQCGLGAFSAAMLHILAHSIYKAHAFLNSGTSVARNTYRDDSGALGTTMPGYVAFSKVRWATLAAVSCSILAMFAGSLLVFQIDIVQKPGGLLLGSLFCVGVIAWVTSLIRSNENGVLVPAMFASAGLCLVYAACFAFVNKVISPFVPAVASGWEWWLAIIPIFIGIIGVMVYRTPSMPSVLRRVAASLHVHASNGFYVESALRRLVSNMS